MTTPTIARPLTAEEIVARGLGDGCEYIDGKFVERNVSLNSSTVSTLVIYHLASHVVPAGLGTLIDSEQWMQLFPANPQNLRRADVAFLSRGRHPGDVGILRVAPELVVEVASPGDNAAELRAKVELWLSGGVRLVWVVWPGLRAVDVYRADGTLTALRDTDIIDGGDAVPGFSCPIARFFPD